MEIVRVLIDKKKKKLENLSENLGQNADRLASHFKNAFVYAVNALEGGSLSQAEITQVISTKVAVGGKSLDEQNHVAVLADTVDWLRRSAKSSRTDITEQQLISLQHLPFLLRNTESEMLKYSYKVPYVLTEYIEWLHQQNGDTVGIAVDAGVKMLQSRVFSDNVARTALLITNLLLMQSGYPLIFITKKDSEAYLKAVEHVESGGDTREFVEILYDAVDRSLDICLEMLQPSDDGEQSSWLKIGELASHTNESVPTIRHWTKQGLLQVAGYSQGGYQLYAPNMTAVVLKIRELQKEQRMSIKEIAEQIHSS
jgi:Fic family protein